MGNLQVRQASNEKHLRETLQLQYNTSDTIYKYRDFIAFCDLDTVYVSPTFCNLRDDIMTCNDVCQTSLITNGLGTTHSNIVLSEIDKVLQSVNTNIGNDYQKVSEISRYFSAYDLSGYKTRVVLQERFNQFETTSNYDILYNFVATKGETNSNWDAVRVAMDTVEVTCSNSLSDNGLGATHDTNVENASHQIGYLTYFDRTPGIPNYFTEMARLYLQHGI